MSAGHEPAPVPPLPDDLRGGRQDVTTVAGAEAARLLRQGGIVGAVVAAAVAGLVVGLASVPLADAPAGVAGLIAALTLAVAVGVHTGGHTTRGSGPTTLALVPDRRRLAHGRLLGAALLSGLLVGAVALLVGLVAAGIVGGAGAYALALAGALAAAVTGACLAAVAVAVGTTTDHPVGALLALGGWWAVLPLTCVAAGRVLPGPLSWLAAGALQSAPPVLAVAATDLVDPPGGLLAALAAQAGLVGWAGVAVAVTTAVLRRRSVTRDRAYPTG